MTRAVALDGSDLQDKIKTIIVKLIDFQARLDLLQEFVKPDEYLVETSRIGDEIGSIVDLLLHKVYRGQGKAMIEAIADDTFGILIDMHLRQSGAPEDWLEAQWTIPDIKAVPALHWCAAIDVTAPWPDKCIGLDKLLASQREWAATAPPPPPRQRPTLYIVR